MFAHTITKSAVWFGCLLGLLVFPMVAQSTVAEQLSVEELRAQSVFVARAHVLDRTVVKQRGPKGEIYTQIELGVTAYLKGDGPALLRVQQLGGELDGVTLHLEGNAHFQVGDEVVAFLDHDPLTGLSYVVGLAQGVFSIHNVGGSEWVTRQLDGIAFYTAGAAPYEVVQSVMTFTELAGRLGVDHIHTTELRQGGLNR